MDKIWNKGTYTHNPMILLGIYPRKSAIYFHKICTQMFTVALVITVYNLKMLKFLYWSINKLWYNPHTEILLNKQKNELLT